MLYEQNLIFDDHLAALERDSKKHGTTGAEVDFALLLDGLEAEREQGITIDVAYRYFSTARRAFVVADTPGHEQYTRNMATGASNADLAVLLVDARKGLLRQTRRHAIIASLLGIRHVVLAVNKIDLVDFDRAVFERIADGFRDFAAELGFKDITAIPISARYGDNVSSRSERTPWYAGPHLLEHLETVDVEDDRAGRPFRMPVQWVNRPHLDFRGFAGTIVSGSVKPGDEIVVLPSGQTTKIKHDRRPRRRSRRGRRPAMRSPSRSPTKSISRAATCWPRCATARRSPTSSPLIWSGCRNDKLLPGRSYLMKINNSTVAGDRHRAQAPARRQYAVEACRQDAGAERDRRLQSVGCPAGRVRSLRRQPRYRRLHPDRSLFQRDGRRRHDRFRAAPRHQHPPPESDREQGRARRSLMHHRPAVLWFTGLPGAGKSTIANLVEAGLHARGVHTIMLDGDNVRHGLNRDLGFTESDRVENIRRIGEVAKLMTEAGLIVLCSFISPFRAERHMVRELLDSRRIHRGLRRYAARRMHRARSQGTVSPRARRRDQEFHRRRSAL